MSFQQNVGRQVQTSRCRFIAMFDRHLQRRLWIYDPIAESLEWRETDRARWLTGWQAIITGGLRSRRSEVLRLLRHLLRRQSHEHHHCIDRLGLEERQIKRNRKVTYPERKKKIKKRGRGIVKQTQQKQNKEINEDCDSFKATLQKPRWRDQTEHIRILPNV